MAYKIEKTVLNKRILNVSVAVTAKINSSINKSG